jgi:glutamate/tyrosine decarboxylase-like PLP-dependent enzyme
VCFRFRRVQLQHDAEIDRINRELLERLQLGGEAFVTSTELHGRFVLRACIVNHLSSRADVDLMISAVRRIGTELAAA